MVQSIYLKSPLFILPIIADCTSQAELKRVLNQTFRDISSWTLVTGCSGSTDLDFISKISPSHILALQLSDAELEPEFFYADRRALSLMKRNEPNTVILSLSTPLHPCLEKFFNDDEDNENDDNSVDNEYRQTKTGNGSLCHNTTRDSVGMANVVITTVRMYSSRQPASN